MQATDDEHIIAAAITTVAEAGPQPTGGKWLEHLTVDVGPFICDWNIAQCWHWAEWPERELNSHNPSARTPASTSSPSTGTGSISPFSANPANWMKMGVATASTSPKLTASPALPQTISGRKGGSSPTVTTHWAGTP